MMAPSDLKQLTSETSRSANSDASGRLNSRTRFRLLVVAILAMFAGVLSERFSPAQTAAVEFVLLAWIAFQPPGEWLRPWCGVLCLVLFEMGIAIFWDLIHGTTWVSLNPYETHFSEHWFQVIKQLALLWAFLRLFSIFFSFYIVAPKQTIDHRISIQKFAWVTIALSILFAFLPPNTRYGASAPSNNLQSVHDVMWRDEFHENVSMILVQGPAIAALLITIWCFAGARWRLLLLPAIFTIESLSLMFTEAIQKRVFPKLNSWVNSSELGKQIFQLLEYTCQLFVNLSVPGGWLFCILICAGIGLIRWTGMRWTDRWTKATL